MSKHTPGPWKMIQPNTHGGHGAYVADEFDDTICDLYFKRQRGRHNFKNAEANATLIAATPDLFVAVLCAQALDLPYNEGMKILTEHGFVHDDDCENTTPMDFVNQLQIEALAKARGPTP